MNYYIQGSPARAKEIKAALERLGLRADGYDFSRIDVLFFTFEAKGKTYMMSTLLGTGLDNIILTHPDYKELELPVETFKVGDWVVFNNSHNSIYQISEIGDSYYTLTHIHGGSMTLPFSQRKLIRPWTIEDARDGDVLATDSGWTCIFQAFDGCVFSSYCFMDSQKWFCEFGSEAHTLDSRINGNIHPATKEQRDLLFKKMRKAGYQWDAEKKELHKIQSHYDIANFKTFDMVLVRDSDRDEWRASIFSHQIKGRKTCYPFWCVGNSFSQCIPFNEETKHLLGTTDKPSEEFINW